MEWSRRALSFIAVAGTSQLLRPVTTTPARSSSHRLPRPPAHFAGTQDPPRFAAQREEKPLQVFVRDNNVDQALKVLKRRLQREGVFREMKRKRFYEKPSERTTREKAEAIRRARKLARKQAIREGLIAAPKKIARPASSAARPGHSAGARSS